MTRVRRSSAPRALVLVALVGAAIGSGCGGEIKTDQANQSGAKLFNTRCSGCHSLNAANAYGSKPTGQLAGGERTNGPNFNVRKEQRGDVLYAIRNGGFSGAIMPANIVVGADAQKIATFLSKYSGKLRSNENPNDLGGSSAGPSGGGGGSGVPR